MLSDSEIEFFEILLEELEETKESILTVEEITGAMKNRPRENMTNKGLQTWAGRILRQFSLYDRRGGRKGKKRAYRFTYDHVLDVFNRYHLSGDISGEVVNSVLQDHLQDTTYQAAGGNEVVNAALGGNNTTYEPPDNSEVVTPEKATDKTFDHLTRSATPPTKGKRKLSSLEVVS